MLLFDLKGSLGSLKQSGHLYDDRGAQTTSSDVAWEGRTHAISQAPYQKSAYIASLDELSDKIQPVGDLDDDVHVWSDYLRVHVHPRSMSLIREYIHDDIDRPFTLYPLGREIARSAGVMDVHDNQLRSLMEDCDSAQGFQVNPFDKSA